MLQLNQGQFVLHFRQDGDPDDYLCVLGYDTDVGMIVPDAAIASEFFDAWQGVVDNLVSTVSLVEVEMQLMTATGVSSVSDFGSFTGEGGSTGLLQNTAYLVHKHTSAAGRGSQGRMYIPGVPDTAVNNVGVVSGGVVADINADLAVTYAAIGATDAGFPVVNHGPGSPHGLTSFINSFSLDPVCASQRRRLRH